MATRINTRLRGARNWQGLCQINASWSHGLSLHRSLEDIAQQSQTLLVKGKMARVLDKAQDAQEVGRLVEQLRQTILIYQVRRDLSCQDRINVFGIGVTTTINKQPSRTAGCKLFPINFVIGADDWPASQSLL